MHLFAKTQRPNAIRRVTASCAVIAAWVGVAAMTAGTAHAEAPSPTTICNAAVGNPVFPLDRRGPIIEVNQSRTPISINPYRDVPVSGTVDFTALNGPILLFPGYEQTVRFDWENITSHQSGTATGTTVVGGEGGSAYATSIRTGAGKIRVTAHVTNQGSAALGSSDLSETGTCTGTLFTVA